MLNHYSVILLGCLLVASCTVAEKTSVTGTPKKEILYIYPDGSMEFNGRPMNDDEVVIYKDGFGGERAAVLLRVPYKEDFYRDSITVERKNVPIKRIE